MAALSYGGPSPTKVHITRSPSQARNQKQFLRLAVVTKYVKIGVDFNSVN